MNCSFCAKDGVVSAATPTRDASAIPTRFPFIGSSIETPEVAILEAAGPRPDTTPAAQYEPEGVGVSSATSHGLAPICRGERGRWRRAENLPGALNIFRPHQRPWLPQALTFKLKMRKP